MIFLKRCNTHHTEWHLLTEAASMTKDLHWHSCQKVPYNALVSLGSVGSTEPTVTIKFTKMLLWKPLEIEIIIWNPQYQFPNDRAALAKSKTCYRGLRL